ncbi:MAG: radical SAM protein [Pirellula sp.]|jgi:MoaA/NifB/PqqE/SkfB family radical SAM enzyme
MMESTSFEVSTTDRFVVVVRVNTHCDLGCLYCGYSKDVHRQRRSISVKSLLRFGEVLRELQQVSGRKVLVSLLGGEPFQWPALIPVATQLVQIDLSLSVTTNGLALENDQTARFAMDYMDEITISIDGLGADHDRLRGSRGMVERLERIVRRIVSHRIDANRSPDRGAIRGGIKPLIRVNTVLTRHTIADFERFAQRMADWGVDELTFNQLGGNDRPEFYPDNHLLEDQVHQFTEMFPRVRQELRERGLELSGSQSYLHRIACTARHQTIAIEDCFPATRFLFIDETGHASPCSFTSDCLGVPIDQITNATAIEALASTWQQQRRNHRPHVCKDCHATHVHSKFSLPVLTR